MQVITVTKTTHDDDDDDDDDGEDEYYEEILVTDDEEESYIEEIIEEQTVDSDDTDHSPPTQIVPIRLSKRMTMFDAPDLETLEECSVEDSVRTTSSHSVLKRESFRKDRTVTITNLETLKEGQLSSSSSTEQPPNQSTKETPSKSRSGSTRSTHSSRSSSKSRNLQPLPPALLEAMARPPRPRHSGSGLRDMKLLQQSAVPLPPASPMLRPSPVPMRRKTSLDPPKTVMPPALPPQRKSSNADAAQRRNEHGDTSVPDQPLATSNRSVHSEGTATTVASTVGSASVSSMGPNLSSPGRNTSRTSSSSSSAEIDANGTPRPSKRSTVATRRSSTGETPHESHETTPERTRRRSTTERKNGKSRSKSPVPGRRNLTSDKKERSKSRSKSPVPGRSGHTTEKKERSKPRSKSPVHGRRGTDDKRERRRRVRRASSSSNTGEDTDAQTSASSLGGRLDRLTDSASSPDTSRTGKDEDMQSMGSSVSSRKSRSRRSSTSHSISASIPEEGELDDGLSLSSTSQRRHRSSTSREGSEKHTDTPKGRRQKGEDAVRAAAQRRLQRQGSGSGRVLSRSASRSSSIAEESSVDMESLDENGNSVQDDVVVKDSHRPSPSKQKESHMQPSRKLSLDDLLARLPAEQRRGPRDARSTASAFVRSKDKSMAIVKDNDDDCHSLIEGNFSRKTRKDKSRSRSSGRVKKERSKSVPAGKHKSSPAEQKKRRTSSLKREKRKSSDDSPKTNRKYKWWQLDGHNTDDSGKSLPYLATVGQSDHTTDSMDNNQEKFQDSMSNATRDLMNVLNNPTDVSNCKAAARVRTSPSRSRSTSQNSSACSRSAPPRSKSSPGSLSPVNVTRKKPSTATRHDRHSTVDSLHQTPKSSIATIAKPPFISPSPQKKTSSSPHSVSPTNTACSSLSESSPITKCRTFKNAASAKERLSELETIKEFLTREEYKAKRQEILSSI